MAIKISELTAVTSIAGTEVLPVVQSATTKKATASQLKGYRSFIGLLTWDQVNSEADLTTLQNDSFNITNFTRTGAGSFIIEDTSDPFLENKTFLNIQQNNNFGLPEYDMQINTIYRESDSEIRVEIKDINLTGNSVNNTDNLTKVGIEIRVYP
ncbi:MAG: hypothetical protein EBS55_04445 [Flavobacteriaceae bacterium]|nr:hypothetical protein [Flavobacteriaceae bacterium]